LNTKFTYLKSPIIPLSPVAL